MEPPEDKREGEGLGGEDLRTQELVEGGGVQCQREAKQSSQAE